MTTAVIISSAFIVAGVIASVRMVKAKNGTGYRSVLVILIAAVFAALSTILFPITFAEYRIAYPDANVVWIAIGALLQSVQNAMRTFVLDGSWSELLPSTDSIIHIPLPATAVGLVLSVVAPLLTFSAILSLFKELRSKIRFKIMAASGRPLFIFSELNSNTILLAEDIKKKYPKANLVYTDVYPEDDENNYELRGHASRLRAIQLRTDITQLSVGDRKTQTEYFILGHDEEENLAQTKVLFAKNKNRKNTEIYVHAVQKGSCLIIDSLNATIDADGYLEKAKESSLDYEAVKHDVRNGGILRLRRVDPEAQIARRALTEIKMLKDAFSSSEQETDETLSVLVGSNTRLGFNIIKMLLWYCQSEKFKLKLNVVYSDCDGAVNAKALMESECPEIICTNRMQADGESYYDIEFLSDEMFGSGEFTRQVIAAASNMDDASEHILRLAETDMVITDRGSDSATLETDAGIRRVFERLGLKPEIYAVCRSEEDIAGESLSEDIVSYKDESYDINYICRSRDAYSYDNIKNADEENLAFSQHVKWIDVSYGSDASEEREEQMKRELLNYERHEYFRNSSMARAMFMRNVLADPDKELSEEELVDELSKGKLQCVTTDENTRFEARLKFRPEYECINEPKKPSDRWSCNCDKCMLRRKVEHMRWNAYMRTEGYINSPRGELNDKRALAGVHGNLVEFDKLDRNAIEKDS